MGFKKMGRLGFIALALLLALLAGCNSSSFDANLTTKDLPAGWSVTDTGLAYDGTERECFYVTEDTLANQDFRYATDVSFADGERGIAALVFQSSEDSKNCYIAKVDARTNKASLYKIEHGLELPLGIDVKVEDKADYHLQINMVGTHIDFFAMKSPLRGGRSKAPRRAEVRRGIRKSSISGGNSGWFGFPAQGLEPFQICLDLMLTVETVVIVGP